MINNKEQFNVLESNLRNALKYDINKDFPTVVATKFLYKDAHGFNQFINVWCYGKRVKTFEITYRTGYKLKTKTLLKINKKDVDSVAYSNIAYRIEHSNSEAF